MPGLDRFQNRGAQCRRERQRHEGREQDGAQHHHRELAVDVADRSFEEGQRHEDRHQHHGHADDGARNLAHGLARGGQRRQALGAHDAFDVFHHDDGVIDHDTDHQHHAEHGQHVDRKTERLQHCERAQQRNRHHQRRDQGVAEILQEQVHHQEHQDHRFDQGLDHLADRDFDKARTVERNHRRHARREVRREFLQALLDRFRRGHCVAGGRELDADAGRCLAVQP